VAPKVEGHAAPHDGHVVLGAAWANAAVVLAEGDIQHPVDRVFDASVSACGGLKLYGIGRQTGDERACFSGGMVGQASCTFTP
jgi:hypothetical protein